MVSSLQNGNLTLSLLKIDDGKPGAPLTRAKLEGPLLDHRSLLTIGLRFTNADKPYLFFDARHGSRPGTRSKKAFDGEHPQLVTQSDDFSKIIVLVQGPQHGFSYQLVDLQKRQAVPAGLVYDDIIALFPKRSITMPRLMGLISRCG